VIVYRHTDARYPFLWEGRGQPGSRWSIGDEPVHAFADTPDGAWAELLRHEEITDPEDLAGIERDLWAVEVGKPPSKKPNLARSVLTGGAETYAACRRAAKRLMDRAERGFVAPSAALLPGCACGYRVDGGMRQGPARDGIVIVLLGRRPDLVGWRAARRGRPGRDLLPRVRHLGSEPTT
jgi:hypothetical protein